MKHTLLSIDKINLFLIKTNWADGFSSIIKIADLRRNCPCAVCKTLVKEEYIGLNLPKVIIGEYDLKAIEASGNYALRFTWGDRHNTGYYSWSLLRELFEEKALDEKEIERLMKGANTPKLKKDDEN